MSDTMTMMLALLAGELLLLLLVLLSIAWFRGRAARRRDERAIRLLVTRIRNSMAEREAGIERFLDEGMGLSGEVLAQAKNAIRRSELVLLQRFAELYRRRDADAAARFDADLVSALTPYHELKVGAVTDVRVQAPVDDSELERLREQNQLLSDELSANMETMSKMVREFSTMFAESPVDAAAATSTATAEAAADPTGEEATVAESSTDQVSDPPVHGAMMTEGRGEAEGVAQHDSMVESAASSAAQPSVQLEAGDDLDEVAGMLEEEGPAEVVKFDDPGECDVEISPSEDKASDHEVSEVAAAEQTQDEDVPGPVAEADAAEMDANFDAEEEAPLKAQSRA